MVEKIQVADQATLSMYQAKRVGSPSLADHLLICLEKP